MSTQTESPGESISQARKVILVVGDLVLDRAWWVTSDIAPAAQPHGNVVPRRRLNPNEPDSRPGGAALTAAGLVQALNWYRLQAEQRAWVEEQGGSDSRPSLHRSVVEDFDRVEVHLLGAYGAAQESEFKTLLSADQFRRWSHDSVGPSGVTVHRWQTRDRIEWPTTVKFRVYRSDESERPTLAARYDQEAEPGVAVQWAGLDECLPSAVKDRVLAVVITDLCKGLMTPEVWRELRQQLGHLPWFIDSKNPELGTGDYELPDRPSTLFPNRTEFLSWVYRGDTSPYEPDEIGVDGRGRREALCRVLEDWAARPDSVLRREVQGQSAGDVVCVKLDREGAVAIHCQGSPHLYPHWLPPETQRTTDGIGAGDLFLAHWVAEQVPELLAPVPETTAPQSKLPQRLAGATAGAIAWLKAQDSPRVIPAPGHPAARRGFIRSPADIEPVDYPPGGCCGDARPVVELIEESQRLRSGWTFPEMLRPKGGVSQSQLRLCRQDAGGWLGSFLTTDLILGRQVQRVGCEVKRHIQSTAGRLPWVCRLWSEEGLGRTHLARELARMVDSQLMEVSVETGSGDPWLVMDTRLPEFQSKGKPVVLLIQSDRAAWDSTKWQGFLGKLRRPNLEKSFPWIVLISHPGPVSVLGSRPDIVVDSRKRSPDAIRVDRVYRVAQMLKDQFPSVSDIEFGPLHALVHLPGSLNVLRDRLPYLNLRTPTRLTALDLKVWWNAEYRSQTELGSAPEAKQCMQPVLDSATGTLHGLAVHELVHLEGFIPNSRT
jgi:hypothetical protein